jgi:hypothetical protein
MMNQCSPEQLSVCKESSMKKLFVVLIMLGFAAIAFAGQADARPGGCVKGAIVGGIVGHFAGHGGIGPPLVVPMEYTSGTAMTVKTATKAGRATNGVA